MRITIALLLAGLACAQRDFGSSGDRFDPSRGRGSSSSSRDRDRDSFSSGGGGSSFPQFFRVEVEIQRLENRGGLISNGKSCDLTSVCDPRIYAYLDANQALAPWPGGKPEKEWPSIFEATDNDSPTIGKSINRDVCGGAVNNVRARVKVEDVDVGINNDLIGRFECPFKLDPMDVARDALSAKWSASIECVPTPASGTNQDRSIKLFARVRSYEIPASSCQAEGGAKGSIDSFNSGAKAKVAGEHDFIRMDVELVQLLNPQGITFKKEKCDTGNACDPWITAYIDTDKPLAVWPGSKVAEEYTKIFSVDNVDSPVINKNISKNICGGAVSQVNVRVRVQDSDSFSFDPIEDFECTFEADYRRVARDMSSSDWTSTQDCKPIHPGHDIRLQYRYRLYDIAAKDCGIKPTSG